jgi:hypothetical protein
VAPARLGSVRGEVVDDGGAPGTGGSSWGGSNRRRRPPGTGGSDLQIGAAPARIERVVWWLRSSERWRARWCAQIDEGSALFIATRGCCGAVRKSTCSRLLRRASELGEGVALFCGSWRSVWRRQRGRAVAGLVALLPLLPRRSRKQVVVSGAGGHGSGLRACLARPRWHGDAQRARRGSRGCVYWRGGAWPVRVHGAHGRDASGILAVLGAHPPAIVELLLDQGLS